MADEANADLLARIEQLEGIVHVLTGFIAKHINDNEKVSFGWALGNVINPSTEYGRDWPEAAAAMKLLSRTQMEERAQAKD